MKKRILLFALLPLLGILSTQAQTACSELFFTEYVEGSGNNKALEIYNPSTTVINLSNYEIHRFSNGSSTGTVISLSGNLDTGAVYVIANPSATGNFLSEADATSSNINFNGNDAVALIKGTDTIDIIGQIGVDSVWVVGTGSTQNYTLVRNASVTHGETDWNNSVLQWDVYAQNTDTYIGSHTSNTCAQGGGGNPTPTAIPAYDIATVHTEDANGLADSVGVECKLTGIVTSIDFDGNAGINFFITDATGSINVFNFQDVNTLSGSAYVVTAGDSIEVWGDIAQYYGLTEIVPDSINVLNSGNSLPAPMVITSMGEANESERVRMNGMSLVDTTQWPSTGSSANVDITDGTNTFAMRIDSDTDIDGGMMPTGTFDVIGHVGQFDSSSPHDDGYQLYPNSMNDFVYATTVTPDPYPLYTIATVRSEDANGVADSSGVMCSVQGIVTSIDFDGNTGLNFFLQDMTGGINVFNFGDVDVNGSAYVVTVGDELKIFGEIDQYNGLTQIVPDSIEVMSTGNALPAPAISTDLDASNEGLLVRMNGMSLVNASQWPSSGSSASVDITDGTNTFTLRIDSDTDIDGSAAPTGTFDVIGNGGQFDNSSPYDAGYQILPSELSNIIASTTTVTPSPYPLYPIATVHTEDSTGVADSLDVMCSVQGIVTSVDFDGNTGLNFFLQDMTGGINIYNFADVDVNGSPYVVTAGDELKVFGEVKQYYGLTEILADSIAVMSTGNALPVPAVTTALGETTEGNLIRMNGMSLVDTTQWPAAGSSANVDITDGTNTFTMRIDSDTDIDGSPVPTGTFDVIGNGGQFDSSSPYDAVYQLLPSTVNDIMTIAPPAGPCGDLFFSEYIEGSGNNKALEIYNPTSTTVDLSDYQVVQKVNSGPNYNIHNLSGMLAPGDVYVIGNDGASEADILAADTLLSYPSPVSFNGNDAVMLVKDSTTFLDIIGDIDTSYYYAVTGGSMSNYTLVRNNTVNEGSTDWAVGQTQWTVYPQNTTTDLGSHTMIPCGAADPIVGFTTPSVSVLEDAGVVTVNLSILNANSNPTSVSVGISTLTTAQTLDYGFTWTTVTFPGGSTANQQVTVTIVDDQLQEGAEDVVLFVYAPTNNATIGNLNHTITILDNDQVIPSYDISDINGVDADGVADSVDVICKLTGVVTTINYRPSGLQFGLQDATGGIAVFSFNPVGTYSPTMGDEIRVTGAIDQYNGLLEIVPDSIYLIQQGTTLPAPVVSTTLGEAEENIIVRYNNLSLVDPTQWGSGSSGFNVDVTDGTNTYQMRIDSDCDLYSMPAPGGTFDAIGWGQQYDPSSPYTSGYQFFPRTSADIIGATLIIPSIHFNEVMTENNSTIMDDNNEYDAWVEIYNAESNGVDLGGYYLSDDAANLTKYQVPAGQFGTTVPAGGFLLVWVDGDDTQGALHTSFDIAGSNSGDLYLTAGDGMTVVDTISYTSPGADLSYGASPDGSDNMMAFVNGPTPLMSNAFSSIIELDNGFITIYPNPVSTTLHLEVNGTNLSNYEVFDLTGRVVRFGSFESETVLDVQSLPAGTYSLRVVTEMGREHVKFIKF